MFLKNTRESYYMRGRLCVMQSLDSPSIQFRPNNQHSARRVSPLPKQIRLNQFYYRAKSLLLKAMITSDAKEWRQSYWLTPLPNTPRIPRSEWVPWRKRETRSLFCRTWTPRCRYGGKRTSLGNSGNAVAYFRCILMGIKREAVYRFSAI